MRRTRVSVSIGTGPAIGTRTGNDHPPDFE
jgi:hypothetical protein